MELKVYSNRNNVCTWWRARLPYRHGGTQYLFWVGPLFIRFCVGATAMRRIRQWLPLLLLTLSLLCMMLLVCDVTCMNCDYDPEYFGQ